MGGSCSGIILTQIW